MTYHIKLHPSGRGFPCTADETILAAALRAGIGLVHGCKHGSCGACRAVIVSGTVTDAGPGAAARSGCLLCCAHARSDLLIEAREIAGGSDYPVRRLPCRVSAIDSAGPDVMLLTLQPAAGAGLRYRAGQYVDVLLRGGARRSYSIANAPDGTGSLSLHIRRRPGGLFTEQVFHEMQERHILRLEGPHGSFFLREEADKPIVLLASGTGFGPIKAIVERLIQLGSSRPVTLYWSGRRPGDHYMDGLCRDWASALGDFRYVPVVPAPGDGARALARRVVADFPELCGHQVYACGAPGMVERAKNDLVRLCGLPEDEFYADVFTSAPGTGP